MTGRRSASVVALTAVILAVAGPVSGPAGASSTGNYTVTCQRTLSAMVVGAPSTPPVVDSFVDTEHQRSMPCSGSVSSSASTASADAGATSTAAIGDLTAAVDTQASASSLYNGVATAGVSVTWNDLLTVTGSAPAGTAVTFRLTLTLDEATSTTGSTPCQTSGSPSATAQATFSGLVITDNPCSPAPAKTVTRDMVTSVGAVMSMGGMLNTAAEATTQPGGLPASAAVNPAHAVAHIDVLTAGAGYTTASGADYRSPSAPAITSGPLPDGDVGQDYGFSVTATGVPAPTFSATGLPDGVSIDPASGVILGSPNTAGTYHVTVTATNGVHPDATETYDVTIGGAPAITSGPLPDGLVGQDYRFTVTADGMPAPTFTAEGLPDGLGIDPSTGVISGTPSTGSSYLVVITASNGVGDDATATYPMSIDAPPVFTSGLLPDGVMGGEYDVTVTAGGWPQPTFSATGLPDGLGIDPVTGEVSGSVDKAGPFHVTVTASNGIAPDATAEYDVTIRSVPSITSGPLPDGAVGRPYDFTVTASGQPAPTFAAGGLPDGLAIDPTTGEITGTPTTAGPAHVTVSATNGIGPGATADYDLTIGAPLAITSGPLPDGVVGQDYGFTVTATGLPSPTFSATGLPYALAIDPATGVISGRPTEAGSSFVTVTASNGIGPDVTAGYVLTIDIAPAITSGQISDGVVGQDYGFTVTATGLPAPTFSATGLPDGLSIDATTGRITGTPTTAGAAHVTVTASNGTDPDATASYDLTIAPAPMPVATFSPSPLDFGTVPVRSTGTQVVTVTNTGDAPLTVDAKVSRPFQIDGTVRTDCGWSVLRPGSSCTLHVRFTPTAPGTVSGSLTVFGLGAAWTDTLTGTGGAPFTFSPSPLDFGLAPLRATTVKVLTLGNPSTRSLSITDMKFTDRRFQLQSSTGDCRGSVPAAGSCTLHIGFTPTAPGPVSARLDIAAGGGTWSESVTGVGGGPTFSPSPLDFGQAPVRATTVRVLTLGNPSTSALSISRPRLSDPRFDVEPLTPGDCKSDVPAQGSCTFHIGFTPAGLGPATGTLTITAAGVPSTEALTGTGVPPAPVVTLSPSSLAFGGEAVGDTSSPLQVTITNTGSAVLQITGLAAGGDFAVARDPKDCMGLRRLAPRDRCRMSVTFSPTVLGARSGTLTLTGSGGSLAAGAWTVSLTGRGLRPRPGL